MGGKLGNHGLVILQDVHGLNNKFGSFCKNTEKMTLSLLSDELLINN